MATTRLYPAAGTPVISPSTGGWNSSPLVVREMLSTDPAAYADNGTPATVGSGTANENTCVFQSIYGPINGMLFSGNFKGRIGAREAAGATDARIQSKGKIVAPDGTTVRGLLWDLSAAALASEFNVDSTNRIARAVPLGAPQAYGPLQAFDGDFVVLETGFRNHGTNTGNVRMGSIGGTGSGDMPEDETTNASGYRIWYEFDQTIRLFTPRMMPVLFDTGTAML